MFGDSYRKRLATAPFRTKEDEEMYAVPFESWPSYKAQHPERFRTYHKTLEELADERCQSTLQFEDTQYRLLVCRSSVCELAVDAVQNAANGSLLGGGGVDGAIHDTAGYLITRECADRYEAVETAGTVITKGYRLPAHYVIHTVGPVYYHEQSRAPKLLELCYQRTYELCEQHRLSSLGLCCISCGIYGYPPESAAYIAIGSALKWCQARKPFPKVFVFVTFTDRETRAYRRAFAELLEEAPRLEHSLSSDGSQDPPQLFSQNSVPVIMEEHQPAVKSEPADPPPVKSEPADPPQVKSEPADPPPASDSEETKSALQKQPPSEGDTDPPSS